MRIAFAIEAIKGGGSERKTANLCNMLCKSEDLEIYLFTPPAVGGEYPLDERVHRCCVMVWHSGAMLENTRLLGKALVNYKIDIVFAMSAYTQICLCAMKKKRGAKVIVAEQNAPAEWRLPWKFRLARHFLCPRADGFIFQTMDQKAYYARRFHGRGIVIPNPLPVSDLSEPYEGQRDKRIVSVGRMSPQKNQALLLEAFAKIADEFPDYTLTLYGEGEQRKQLEEKIDAFGLRERVHLPGFSDNIWEEIKTASLFVLSSDYEGMPNALVEAMALGLPCISTDCAGGGPRSLIVNEKNGVLVPIGDAKAMAQAMRDLLRAPDRAAVIGHDAIKVRDKLDAKKIAYQWLELSV